MRKNSVKSTLLLLNQFGFTEKTLREIYKNDDNILNTIFDKNYLFYDRFNFLYSEKEKELASDYEQLKKYLPNFKDKMFEYKNKAIKIFFFDDVDFPHYLFKDTKLPLFLFCYGNLNLLESNKKKTSIVGTRKPSQKSINRTEKIVKSCIDNDIITVSGLAKGIDTVVHKETLRLGGKTIAILPSSFENIYPKENESLFYEIINRDGLIVTTTGPFENIYKSNFLDRNTLVANICDDLYFIEASIKSGTLNTVRKAFQRSKKIYYDSALLDKEVIDYIKKYKAIDLT